MRCNARLPPYFLLLLILSCPSSLCCHTFDEFSKFIANVFRQNEFCFFLFNERQTIVDALAFPLAQICPRTLERCSSGTFGLSKMSFAAYLYSKYFCRLSFFSCFCFPPPFLSKRRRPRRGLAFSQSWFQFCKYILCTFHFRKCFIDDKCVQIRFQLNVVRLWVKFRGRR